MPLTFQDASDHVEFVLGDDGEGALHRSQSTVQLINEAGMWLSNAHDWTFYHDRQALLAVPAGETWTSVDLPNDFRSFVDARIVDTTRRFKETTGAHLRAIREGTAGTDFSGTSVLFSFGSRPPDTGGVAIRTMDVYPSLGEGEVVQLTYNAGWPFTNGSSLAPLPMALYMETLFRAALTALARGYQDDSTLERLTLISQSEPFRAAKLRDGALGQQAIRPRYTGPQIGALDDYQHTNLGHTAPFR